MNKTARRKSNISCLEKRSRSIVKASFRFFLAKKTNATNAVADKNNTAPVDKNPAWPDKKTRRLKPPSANAAL